ncbi:MAG: TetM/TetW/TetO/TetS family tetracycline resistance ribosomal protection protein [Lachnospiraceae bacterium]|nr:TetM/TetW/TetO/TetS family tetracycline resistance ribosomal protection protein [Lachnospiraceae bacterium]
MHTDREGQHAYSSEPAGKSSRYNRTCCAGLLAHVDAGKTTLAEGILYLTGRIRSLGRVDHQDAFFDNFEMERSRGITIFSKQAQVVLEAKSDGRSRVQMTILDTPGHVDFSAEMERTLQVLDYAVLVISGADGVQSHVETLWRLLARYEIPVFLFVNKMDQPGTDRHALMAELTQKLDDRCMDFTVPHDSEEFQENLAMCDEGLLESYLSGTQIGTDAIAGLIAGRQVFPCYFGSALKLQGVEELLEGLRIYCLTREYPEEFGARVFKITRDAQGNRLTHMKITGGTLHVKDVLTNRRDALVSQMQNRTAHDAQHQKERTRQINNHTDQSAANNLTEGGSGMNASAGRMNREIWEEKVNQIRIFSGANYETVPEVQAGTICAVTGLDHTYAGEGLGIEPEGEVPVLEPVLSYRMELLETPPRCASAAERTRINRNAAHLAGAPEGTDVHRAFRQLKQLEEEEPQLHITWAAAARARMDGQDAVGGSRTAGSGSSANAAFGSDGAGSEGEIHAQLMGEVQTEVLQNLIQERFGWKVRFGEGSIVYRETIAAPVVGMGHFEPLRHYAEVHLLMEPAERGSGLQFESRCSVDELDLNWQRLVLTHLEEKSHLGVLTGSEITDMKITLVAGRAHQKHTEGGDFRQATYRAVRQGLCRAENILLEPVYSFRMEVPMEAVGRALSDIQRMYGSAGSPEPVYAARGSDSGRPGGIGAAGGAGEAIGSGTSGDTGESAGAGSSDESPGVGVSHASGTIAAPGKIPEMMVIEGTAPVVTMRGYQRELLSYTKGRGRLSCRLKGYEECHNAQEVIAQRGYDAQADTENPCGSVFCAHGAGFVVNWDEVPDYAHIRDTDAYAQMAQRRQGEKKEEDGDPTYTGGADRDAAGSPGYTEGSGADGRGAWMTGSVLESSANRFTLGADAVKSGGTGKAAAGSGGSGSGSLGSAADDDELREIFERTYGSKERERNRFLYGRNAQSRSDSGWAGYEASQTTRPAGGASISGSEAQTRRPGGKGKEDECLLVDGYNIIFAWEELNELAKDSLESARGRLLDLMSNYQGYKGVRVIVVFDAYRVAGHATEVSRYHNIYVVYTKEAETADQYIEKTVREMKRKHKYHVTVATSDALEQVIILGAGAMRMSARGLQEEVAQMQAELRTNYLDAPSKGGKVYLLDGTEDIL